MKSKSMKKLASVLMSIVMAVGLMPLPAFAATAIGGDTSDNASVLAATGLLGATPEPQPYVEDKKVNTAIPGDVLDGVKIRFRPKGSHKPVSINDDGNSGQNVAHLYYNGKSSQFQLQKADDDSYYFYFYQHYKNAEPKTTDNCLLDVERTGNDASYEKEGQVIHITGKGTALNKQWRLIPQPDGTYHIQNVRSGLYMSLEDLSKPKTNDNKLVQREAPYPWQIEIVSSTNAKLKSIKQYDSYNFTYKGATVNSANWMGALPGTLKITDISIPGTHDVGTCNLNKDQGSMSDQRYYVDEIMNAGVRHLDLRTGLNGNTVRIIHSGTHCLNRDGSELTMYQVLSWIDDFLNANPSETIVLQVKMDKDGAECERKTYAILEERARRTDGKIWAGDHVPTLDEVRGKIVVISRLDPSSLQTDTPFKLDNGLLWGLDCHDWKDSKDKATALTASGSNYEVWTQDNWNHDASAKKPYIKASLLGNTDDGYTNSTLARYEQAKVLGKDAWVFNYTSCSDSPATPFENSKEIHQWLYDRSDYNGNDRLVCSDTFTGVMAFDYVDGLMAKHIYQTNFNRRYVTVHGINMAGNEVTDIKPLTVYVGENESAAAKLLGSAVMKQIIKAHFNVNGYLVKTADAGFMTREKVLGEGNFETLVEELKADIRSDDVPSDIYVHLEAIEPCGETEHQWDAGTITTAPTCRDKGVRTRTCEKCGFTKTEDVGVDPTAHVTYTREMADDTATCEEGGVQTQHEICSVCKEVVKTRVVDTEPLGHNWGEPTYTWSNDKSTVTASHVCTRCNVEESEAVATTNRILEESGCESAGSIAYNADFDNESFDMQETTAESPAIGHSWAAPTYEWSSDDATVTATRVCEHDATHTQSETVQSAYTVVKAATCTEEGQAAYSATFENAAFAKQEKSAANIPAAGHDWGEPTYVWSEDLSQVTATRVCGVNEEHVESETVESSSKVTKAATASAFGLCTYTAKFEASWAKKQTKEAKLPKLAPDPAPVTLAKLVAKGKTKLKLSWNKVAGAERYVVYFAPCNTKGETYKLKKVATLDAGTRSYAARGLEANALYRARVVAQAKVDGKWKALSKSRVVHAATGNKKGKYTNATALELSSTYLALKQGKTATLGGLVQKAVEGENMTAATHTKLLRFITSNKSVATVTAQGEVTANLPGTCKIYVQTSNGLWKSCKVVVK